MDVRSLLRCWRSKGEQPKFGVVCMDMFSKKLYVVQMNTNDTVAVYASLLECFKAFGQPFMIYSDDDGALKRARIKRRGRS